MTLRHISIVVYRRRFRDIWRKSFWVRCVNCDLRDGPFWDEREAKDYADELFGSMQFDRPSCVNAMQLGGLL